MIIVNRSLYHEYFVEETLTCGIVLRGNEVKSIRSGKASIKGAWVTVQDGQLVIRGMHITKWEKANNFDVDEDRERVLLATKKQINYLRGRIETKGYTLVPEEVFFDKGNKCKVKVALCQGKHNYDKRDALRERQVKRDMQREVKLFAR